MAIEANRAGDTFLIVSRGGNQVFRATLDGDGKLNILNTAGTRVDCRIQTGNLPSGVAIRRDGTRGYANNEANFSVTSMNIDDGFCLNGIKLSCSTSLINKLRASHGDRVAVSRIGSALNGAGWAWCVPSGRKFHEMRMHPKHL